jgi:iron(III) transport system substrate-binding protein
MAMQCPRVSQLIASVILLAVLTGGRIVAAAEWALPAGYGEDYREIMDAARREGSLSILGSTDRLSAEPLVRVFEATYPGIKVSYVDLNTNDLDRRYRKEVGEKPQSDIVWSSAMDLQIQLLRDGLAQDYASPETRRLPNWAEYRRQAYAVTYEPVVFAYHRQRIAEVDVPQTHAELQKLLETQPLRNAVATLNPANSSLALLLEAQDRYANPAHARLLKALGSAGARFPVNNLAMLKSLASGEIALGYNVLGSYADVFSRSNPSIGYVLPRDYTLVVSRVMLIAKSAPHPNAARLWLDFVLSQRGQTVMANESALGSVRDDVDGPFTLRRLRQVPGLALRPIGVSGKLLDHTGPKERSALIERWQEDVGAPRQRE